jgi:hypothetical protein
MGRLGVGTLLIQMITTTMRILPVGPPHRSSRRGNDPPDPHLSIGFIPNELRFGVPIRGISHLVIPPRGSSETAEQNWPRI